MDKYCPKHYTSGSQLGYCQIGIMPCPDPLPCDPETTVTFRCGPCDRTMTFPISEIMRRRKSPLGNCVSDTCLATVVLPEPKKPAGKAAPAPVKE